MNKYFEDMRLSQIFAKIFVAYKMFPKIFSKYFAKVFVFATVFANIRRTRAHTGGRITKSVSLLQKNVLFSKKAERVR